MPRNFLRLALMALLTGCSTTHYGIDSPYYPYPQGTHLVLNQPLEIQPDSATFRLQYGREVARNSVQEQDPYCIFEISTVSDKPQQVQPDDFAVTRVQRSISTIARDDLQPTGLIKVGMGFDSSGQSNYYYKTRFYLHSDVQPNVRMLTCQSNQNYTPIRRYLTVAEIRQALGDVFTLRLPN
jgi:hypothetical protein